MRINGYDELSLSISNFSISIYNQITRVNLQMQANLKLVSTMDRNNNYKEDENSILEYNNNNFINDENFNSNLNGCYNNNQIIISHLDDFIQPFLMKRQTIISQPVFIISMSEYNKDAPIQYDFVYRTDSYIKSFITNVFLFLQIIIKGLATKCSLARKCGIKKISKPNCHFFIGKISRVRYKELMNYTIYYLFTHTPSDGKISRQVKNKIILDKVLNIQIEKTQSKNEDYKKNLKKYIPLIQYLMTLTLKEIIECYYYDSQVYYDFKNNKINCKKDLMFKKEKGFSLIKKFGLSKYALLKSYKNNNKNKHSIDD